MGYGLCRSWMLLDPHDMSLSSSLDYVAGADRRHCMGMSEVAMKYIKTHNNLQE